MPYRSMILTTTLFMVLAIPAAAQTPAGGSTVIENDLPAATNVITRYVRALGGEEAIRAHESATIKAKFEVPAQGLVGDMTIQAMAPNLMLLTMQLDAIGTVTSGYNGKVGWSNNPMTGPMLVEGGELEQLKQEADFYASLHYDKIYETMETVEETEFADEPCYKLRLVTSDGNEQFEYFSKKTGLLRGSEMTAESPMGEIDVVAVIEEYKDFGGIMTPVVTRQEMMMMEQVITVQDVQYDNVSKSVFELPAEIKGLVKDHDHDGDGHHGDDDHDHDGHHDGHDDDDGGHHDDDDD